MMQAAVASEPGYVTLLRSGVLADRVGQANHHLRSCDLCARYCRTDRLASSVGALCRTGAAAVVYGCGPNHGEEDPISGWRGAGSVLFSWCCLRCAFCQDWKISQLGEGRPVSSEELASMMLELQAKGCHNINFSSPSHVVAQIISAVFLAAEKGLRLPLVYNTGGYDSLEALRLLDGIIDIYLPDMKYGSCEAGSRYSGVADYVDVNRTAVREMHRQVGDLVVDSSGVAVCGLLVRHLVLPGDAAASREVLAFLAREISPETYVNVMDQYFPCYRANDYPLLDRALSRAEHRRVLDLAESYGLRRLDDHNERRRLGL